MNIEKKIEILEHKVDLLSKMVNQDEYLFYTFMLDHDVTQKEHQLIIDILYVLNHRLRASDDENNRKHFNEQKISMLSRNIDSLINLEKLFVEETPTYDEFNTYINTAIPNIDAVTLLKRLRKQEIYPNLCDHLLFLFKK